MSMPMGGQAVQEPWTPKQGAGALSTHSFQGFIETEQDGNHSLPSALTARMLAQNEPHASTPQGTPQGTPKIMSRIPSALIPTLSHTGCPAMEPMKPRTSLNQPGRFPRSSPRP